MCPLWAFCFLLLTASVCLAALKDSKQLPRFITPNLAGGIADYVFDTENEYEQLHDRGTRRYTDAEIRAWPNNSLVYIKVDYAAEFTRKVLPLVPHSILAIVTNGDESVPLPVVQRLLGSGKVSALFGINLPFLSHKIHHWPLGFNNQDRETGNPQILAAWYDRVYGHSKSHLSNLFAAKKSRVFLPALGRTHTLRDELKAWVDAQDPATTLVDYHTQNYNFTEYLQVMSTYKFCLCPRGNGIDAHRVWECLLVGSVPVYVSNDPTPGALHEIQAERYVTDMRHLGSTLHHVAAMHAYLHVTFMWRSREFLLSSYHMDQLQQVRDYIATGGSAPQHG